MRHRSESEELHRRIGELEKRCERTRAALLWIMDNVALDTAPILLGVVRTALKD